MYVCVGGYQKKRLSPEYIRRCDSWANAPVYSSTCSICTVQWDFNVYLYGTPCALNAKFHIVPIQLSQCSCWGLVLGEMHPPCCLTPRPTSLQREVVHWLHVYSYISCFNEDDILFIGGQSFARVTTAADCWTKVCTVTCSDYTLKCAQLCSV